MRIRALLTAGALAVGFAVTPIAVAPSMSAQGVDVPGVSAEAFQGWGGVCKRERIKVASGTGWVRYANKEYRWFTSSLTGSKCLLWSTNYVTIRYY